jgi:hypothetical protein
VSAFTDTSLKVFNRDYDTQQARLDLTAGNLSGGGGRFSIVGGFQGALVAGTPAGYSIRFDTTGVALDSTYEATLTFSSGDEALPGAQPQPDLVVTLRARPTRAGADTPVGPPAALYFYPPRPNPSAGAVHFAFDLPKAAPVRLEVFDLSGRRVASLLSGPVEAGRHDVVWQAGGMTDRFMAGLFYVRFATPGLTRVARLVLLP